MIYHTQYEHANYYNLWPMIYHTNVSTLTITPLMTHDLTTLRLKHMIYHTNYYTTYDTRSTTLNTSTLTITPLMTHDLPH